MSKLKITPGKAKYNGFGTMESGDAVGWPVWLADGRRVCSFEGMDEVEADANARLYAEAHNVANETGLSPQELMEQRDAAVVLIEKLTAQWTNGDDYGKMAPAIHKMQDFLASLTSPK